MASGIYLLLGTNLGDRTVNLNAAIDALRSVGEIVRQSSVYKTEAWGKTDQPAFYNQVIEINTSFEPALLLQKVLAIEAALGRERLEKWGPRTIDIDILFYGDEIISQTALTIPHPGIPARRFVLTPMNELAANFKHPVLHKTISTLLQECTDRLDVQKV